MYPNGTTLPVKPNEVDVAAVAPMLGVMPAGCTSATDPRANVQCCAGGHWACPMPMGPEMEGRRQCIGARAQSQVLNCLQMQPASGDCSEQVHHQPWWCQEELPGRAGVGGGGGGGGEKVVAHCCSRSRCYLGGC